MGRIFLAALRHAPRGGSTRAAAARRPLRPPADHGPRLRRLLGPGRILQRAPDEPGETSADRAAVERVTRELTAKAVELGAEDLKVTAAKFELEIDTLYRSVVGAETTIDGPLSGDAALREPLRKAYIDAIRVLVAKRATDAGTPEKELYTRNSGRIPMWAWPVAHHLETDISTPIAAGRKADPSSGEVGFKSNGFAVTIAKDGTDTTLETDAVTRLEVTWCKTKLTYASKAANAKILSVDRVGPMCARIQTLYKPPASAAGPSGYGRGTTPEDIAGGRVTPRSTTLGFHEGMHGLDLVDYLASNKPPTFPGKKGMTRSQLTAAVNAQYKIFQDAAVAASAASHCEGKTIDEHAKEKGIPGHRIECSSPAEEKKEGEAPAP